MSFTILQNEKTRYQDIKIRSSKSRKIAIFPKGLTHGFGPKMAIFQPFFFRQYRPEIVFQDILERKNAFLAYKNKNFRKTKNWHFSKGVNPWFWSKNDNFSNFFFLVIEARKISFTILQNKKTPFQAIKTRSSKSQKIDIFPKGLTHGFSPKMAIFRTFFFKIIQAKKMSFMIFQNVKTPFQAIKTRSSKSRKLTLFQRG